MFILQYVMSNPKLKLISASITCYQNFFTILDRIVGPKCRPYFGQNTVTNLIEFLMYQALSKTFLQTFWIKYFYKFFIKNIVKHLVTILPQIFNSSFPQIWVQKIGLSVAGVHTSQVRNSFNSNHIKPK